MKKIKNIDSPEFDCLSAKVDNNFLVRFFHKIKYLFILPVFRLVKKNDTLLDAGCAKGGFLKSMSSMGYNNLYGMDLCEKLYKDVKENKNIVFIKASVTSPSIQKRTDLKNKFTAICLQSIIHHIDVNDYAILAKNIDYMLKPGGLLFIYEPNRVSFIGHFFYEHFLQLIPYMYKNACEEREIQKEFCSNFDTFINHLFNRSINNLIYSKWSFYFALILKKNLNYYE